MTQFITILFAITYLGMALGRIPIVAERAKAQGVRLTFRDHAKAGLPITVLSMLFAGLWLWLGGFMAL